MWNDAGGELHVELDHTQYAAPADLTPDARRRIINLLTQVRPWLEGETAPSTRQEKKLPALGAVAKAPDAAPEPSMLSIVGQVNVVLQNRLLGTPLADRQIRLGETPGGGVRVHIGADHFDGIDAIPDADVKAAILAAIKAWETGK